MDVVAVTRSTHEVRKLVEELNSELGALYAPNSGMAWRLTRSSSRISASSSRALAVAQSDVAAWPFFPTMPK